MQVEAMPLRRSEDIVRMRQAVRERAVTLGFGLADVATHAPLQVHARGAELHQAVRELRRSPIGSSCWARGAST